MGDKRTILATRFYSEVSNVEERCFPHPPLSPVALEGGGWNIH